MNDTSKKRTRTVGQQMGFEKAQDARSAMKLSPLKRHLEKAFCTLQWLHGWGHSTAVILMAACRSSSPRFLTSLKAAGLIRSEKVLGQTFWLCTRRGVEMLRSWSPDGDEIASLDAARGVNLYAFSHNMYAQQLLAQKLKRAPSTGARWLPERALRAREAGRPVESGKCPDALYVDSAETVYFEVERTKKKQPELEVTLLGLARLIESRSKACVEMHVATGIAPRYHSTLGQWLSTREFRAWERSVDGDLFESGKYQMTESLIDAFRRIKLIESKTLA
jgi:hypothetical protein